MDAPECRRESTREPTPASSSGRRPRYVRAAIAWLAFLLAAGLWQAYGAWLFSEPHHVF